MAAKATGDPSETASPGDLHRHLVTVDDSNVTVSYANFCRVSILPEELVLDMGINTQALGPAPQTVKASQRVVMSYNTAHRMVTLLTAALQRHEQLVNTTESGAKKQNPAGPTRPPG